jgi:nucleotide-binding universal stress UspA family protein
MMNASSLEMKGPKLPAGARRADADANDRTPEHPGPLNTCVDDAVSALAHARVLWRHGAFLGARQRRHRGGRRSAACGHAATPDLRASASVPVAVAADGCADCEPHVRVIGCGFDGSPGSYAALRWAAALARRRHARLEVVMVLTRIPFGGVSTAGALGYRSANDTLHQMLEEQMRTALTATANGIVTSRVLVGDPAERLATASAELDLLVLGSRGHGPVRAALLGSVSRAAVRSAHCPVVVVTRGAATSSMSGAFRRAAS